MAADATKPARARGRPAPPILYTDDWLRETWPQLDPNAPLAPQLRGLGVPDGNAPRLRKRAEALGCKAGGVFNPQARRENPWDIFDRVIAVLEHRHSRPWRADAACRDHPTSLFFNDATVKQAKEICATCPVHDECLADNLNVPRGVFGGRSAAQRKALTRQRTHLEPLESDRRTPWANRRSRSAPTAVAS